MTPDGESPGASPTSATREPSRRNSCRGKAQRPSAGAGQRARTRRTRLGKRGVNEKTGGGEGEGKGGGRARLWRGRRHHRSVLAQERHTMPKDVQDMRKDLRARHLNCPFHPRPPITSLGPASCCSAADSAFGERFSLSESPVPAAPARVNATPVSPPLEPRRWRTHGSFTV